METDPDIARRVAAIHAKAEGTPETDDGYLLSGVALATAVFEVLARRMGLGFVLEVQEAMLAEAERLADDESKVIRRDAAEIADTAVSGIFTSIIDELVSKGTSGKA